MPTDATTIYAGIFLFIIYLALLLSAGLMSFKKGHTVIGIVGFIFPPLWLAGALMPPKKKESHSAAAASQPKTSHSKTSQPKSNGSTSTAATSHSNSHSKKKRRRHK